MEYNGLHPEILYKMEEIIDLFDEIETLILHRDEGNWLKRNVKKTWF